MHKFMFVGDLHSCLDRAEMVAELAKDWKCKEIIQVGDWGYKWPTSDTSMELSKILEKYSMPMRFIDGNHELHPELRALPEEVEENLAPFLTYQHRGTIKEFDDGTTMVFLGGAPSIDREMRVKDVNWWEEEYITEDDVEKALQHQGRKVHILVTHDCAVPPPGIKETDNMSFNYRARESHASIKKVIRGLRPSLNVHGHYHFRYDSEFEGTRVLGLASDIQKFEDSFYIFQQPPRVSFGP